MARRTTTAAPKRVRTARKGARKPAAPKLPRHQLALPAGYLADGGGVATLRDVLSPRVPTIDGASLTDDDRVALTLLRIDAQRDLKLAGAGFVLDKPRALEEVRQRTALGRTLVAIEQRAIEFQKEAAAAQLRRRQATPARARGRSKKPRR